MNILFVTERDPRQTADGAAQRTYFLWQALNRCGNVWTVIPVGLHADHWCDDKDRIATAVFAPKNIWISRILQRLPLVWPWRSKNYIRRQIPWRDVQFDCVVTRYTAVAASVSAWRIAPCYIDIDDLPSEVSKLSNVKRINLTTILRRIMIGPWQRYVWRQCAGAWIANPAQSDLVRHCCPCGVLRNIPLPRKIVSESFQRKPVLLSVGNLGYRPNYEGIDRFLRIVWNGFRRLHPEYEYWVAGGGLPQCYADQWSKLSGVKLLGYVPSVDEYYSQCSAVVVPIDGGGGTCIKLIEAVQRGCKVFATKFGARGLSDEEMIRMGVDVYADAEEFNEKYSQWLNLPVEARDGILIGSSSYASELFSRQSFSSQVSKLLNVSKRSNRE